MIPTPEMCMREIQAVLSDDLLSPKYLQFRNRHPHAGHCYAASEALFWMIGGLEAGHSLCQIRHEDVSHWFVRTATGTVLDPTAAQFDTPVPYHLGKANNGFVIQHGVSKRAAEILRRLGQ